MDFGQPPLGWDSELHGTFHAPDSLHAINNMTKDVLENEFTTTTKLTAALKKDWLPKPLDWEHISSTELKPHEAIKEVKYPRKTGGRRHGRLNPETAKHAQEMRHLRACLPCSILKIKVS